MAKTSFEVLSFKDADKRLDGGLSVSFQGSYERVLLFPGDLAVTGDFEKAVRKLCKEPFDIIAVDGDLTVKGRIALYGYKPGLYVRGYTTAETLEGGDCEIYISDGKFEYFVYGYYNDGILETGTVDTPWVINSNHDLRVDAGKKTKRIDNYGDDDDYDFGSENIAASFVPEVVSENEIDITKFYKRLVAGKPVLATGAQTNTEKALAEAKAAKKGRKTEFVNTSGKLKAFPKDVLKMTWLEKLVLDGNEIGKVPKEIGKLVELRELSLNNCALTSLPAEIGKLTKLEILRIGGNERKLRLPQTIGNLANLVELDVSDMSEKVNTTREQALPDITTYELPAAVAKLKKLRTLRACCTNLALPKAAWGLPSLEVIEMSGSSWVYLKEFPAWVTSFPNLKRLDLSSQFFTSVPKLDGLKNLEDLDLGNSLGRVKALPNLSKLTKLRRLNVSGNTDRTNIAEPLHSVLRPLFEMKLTALEDLRIDRWGKADLAKRGDLPPATIAGIGNFTNLKKLDIEFDGLKSLPADFYKLTAIEELKLGYNRLGKKELAKIKKTFPKASIEIGSQD